MGFPLLLCLATLLFTSGVATVDFTEEPTTISSSMATGPNSEPTVMMPDAPFFQVGPDAIELSLSDGHFQSIELQQPFKYGERTYSQLYLSMNGYVTFVVPNVDEEKPNPLGDVIAPLWTDLEANQGGRWTYEQVTSGPLLDEATNALNKMTSNPNFTVSWVFVSTWENVPVEMTLGVASLQVVLISGTEGFSFILMNYGTVPSIPSSYWLAGYGMENDDFFTISLNDSAELSLTSNVYVAGRWAFPVSLGSIGPPATHPFYPCWNGTQVDLFDNNGSSPLITLQQPFRFFGSDHYVIFVNKNGLLSFSEPLSEAIPDMNGDLVADLIAPFWTDFELDYSETVVYEEVTDGPLLHQATQDINSMFPGNYFDASWLFIATWDTMSFANSTGNATFQAVLVSNGADTSYVMLNYREIDATDQYWLAGYAAADGRSNFIHLEDSSSLYSSSNIQIPGRWAYQVTDPVPTSCELLNCTSGEVCTQVNGDYGCACGEDNPRPNPETFDAIETCSGSSGSLSLSRCQLFEAGYPSDVFHLNDPTCRGAIHNDRLVFNFDSNVNMCGTTLEHNETHIIFKNNAGTTDGMGVISHVGGLNIAFSCVYPLIQSISMPMDVHATGSVISKELSTEGTYHISMTPYPDITFQVPYSGNVTLDVNHQLYIAVQVDQFDSNQIALVLDNCWATPVNQIDYSVRWDLIAYECPNPADNTVEVLQNGVSTTSYFSFRMFTFTGYSNNIYLHCQVHLCLLGSGDCAMPCDGHLTRRRRAVDFYDSAEITMKF